MLSKSIPVVSLCLLLRLSDEVYNEAQSILYQFVKQWGYDVETIDEYKESKRRFYSWLQSQKASKDLPAWLIDMIRVWVEKHLVPYDSMWVSCFRLYTPGQSQRTTSPGEALHHFMKSGHNAICVAFSTQKTAKTIVNKSERKTHSVSKYNAKQFQSTPLWTDSHTAGILTDYCEKKADEQWELSSRYNVFRYSEDRFYVWSPSSQDNTVYRNMMEKNP